MIELIVALKVAVVVIAFLLGIAVGYGIAEGMIVRSCETLRAFHVGRRVFRCSEVSEVRDGD